MRGALLHNTGDETLEVVDDLTVADPGPGQVKIQIEAPGVCHSDLHAMTGSLPQPAPVVLGHEGAGVITAVGAGVDNLVEGDHVIVAWSPPCGKCSMCVDHKSPHLCVMLQFEWAVQQKFQRGDVGVFGMAGAGTWARETIMPWQGAIKIDDDIPPRSRPARRSWCSAAVAWASRSSRAPASPAPRRSSPST